MDCCMKGRSNWSRLKKNASYNKVLGEQFKFLKKLNSHVRAKPQQLQNVSCKIG